MDVVLIWLRASVVGRGGAYYYYYSCCYYYYYCTTTPTTTTTTHWALWAPGTRGNVVVHEVLQITVCLRNMYHSGPKVAGGQTM